MLQGSITDAQGNVWSLQPNSCQGEGSGSWWSGVYENGQQVVCGYTVALRNVNGVVYEEEAKGSGWQPVTNDLLGEGMVGPYVADPGQGTANSSPASASATAQPAAPTTSAMTPSVNCPGMSWPTATGAVTPGNGSFAVASNTYSIDATDGNVASINGAPINQGAYETSQLVQGSDGSIYGQSSAADNAGQWFQLEGTGGDTWWQPLDGTPAAITLSATAAPTNDNLAESLVASAACPQLSTIQNQISTLNQQLLLLEQQAAQTQTNQ